MFVFFRGGASNFWNSPLFSNNTLISNLKLDEWRVTVKPCKLGIQNQNIDSQIWQCTENINHEMSIHKFSYFSESKTSDSRYIQLYQKLPWWTFFPPLGTHSLAMFPTDVLASGKFYERLFWAIRSWQHRHWRNEAIRRSWSSLCFDTNASTTVERWNREGKLGH